MFTFLGAPSLIGILFALVMVTSEASLSCKHRDEVPTAEDAAPAADLALGPAPSLVPAPAAAPAPALPWDRPTPTARPNEQLPEAGTTHFTPLAAASALRELGRAPSPENGNGPTVIVGAPQVTGGPVGDLDPSIRRMRAGFRACYARSIEAAEDPPDASTFSLRLVVMPNGSVRSVTALGASGAPPSLVDCMVRRAQMATFPASMGDGIEIVLPLGLHP